MDVLRLPGVQATLAPYRILRVSVM
jgi:hypothetical protein